MRLHRTDCTRPPLVLGPFLALERGFRALEGLRVAVFRDRGPQTADRGGGVPLAARPRGGTSFGGLVKGVWRVASPYPTEGADPPRSAVCGPRPPPGAPKIRRRPARHQ